MKHSKKGFTLIELLIVVAIIAILAAIAVPNFLEAQTRSKVSRAKADMRSTATALEAYCVDYQKYPWPNGQNLSNLFLEYLTQLSTPVAYITSTKFVDPFFPVTRDPNTGLVCSSIRYFNYECIWWWINDNDMYGKRAYCLASYGPDRDDDYAEHFAHRLYPGHPEWGEPQRYAILYDPTNGTKSSGDILYLGGDVRFGGGLAN